MIILYPKWLSVLPFLLLKGLKECEEKRKQDAECRQEIEEAISWYNRVLGFRIERGRGT